MTRKDFQSDLKVTFHITFVETLSIYSTSKIKTSVLCKVNLYKVTMYKLDFQEKKLLPFIPMSTFVVQNGYKFILSVNICALKKE
jgi:hypothetical protein